MIKHIKRWNKWRKDNLNSTFYKFLVLIGVIHSPTFNFTLTEEECRQIYKALEERIVLKDN